MPRQTIALLFNNVNCYTEAKTKNFAKEHGLKPLTAQMTSTENNGIAESFVKTLKREYAKLTKG